MYYRGFKNQIHNTSGIDVLAGEWDSLIILDGCRYDMFEQLSDLPGRLEHRISKGSATNEFLLANFDSRELLDTVYVTANPQLYRYRNQIDVQFHDIIHVWKEDGWDETHGTVTPETMTRYAREAANQYPNKRLIFHYIQPHYPFLGSEHDLDKEHLSEDDPNEENVWNQLMFGESELSTEEVVQLYYDNLERTLPYVETLLDEIKGRTVVTADHGNMLGERASPIPVREWGHPRGIYTEELVKVPWLVHNTGSRRSISADPPLANDTEITSDAVESRLRDLGYKS
jgi:hypothetical protein